jgi:hypothetical protein
MYPAYYIHAYGRLPSVIGPPYYIFHTFSVSARTFPQAKEIMQSLRMIPGVSEVEIVGRGKRRSYVNKQWIIWS